MIIEEIKAAVWRGPDSHWFDSNTLSFFHSRIDSHVYPAQSLFRESERKPGQYFVTSEHPDGEERRYTIRRFDQERATIDNVGEFMAYDSLQAARKSAGYAASLEGTYLRDPAAVLLAARTKKDPMLLDVLDAMRIAVPG